MTTQEEKQKQEFIDTYEGMYNAEGMYNYLQACKKNEELYKNATYSERYNRQLLREANNAAFNHYLRK